MRINQAFVGAKFFQQSFLDKYGMQKYSRTDLPAVFFGCYTAQWKHLQAHRGFAVVIWAGSDVYNLRFNPGFCKFLRENKLRIFHVAISKYIEEDLKIAGLIFKSIPIIPNTYVGIKPVPLGNSVYVYMPEVRREFYGYDMAESVRKLIPKIPFIQCSTKTHCRKTLFTDVYPKCFIGLRLTPHDGLSNTVVELGMMGRRSISNAGYPTVIPWENEYDIVESIEREIESPPNVEKVSKTIKKWLDVSPQWIMTDYWTKQAEIASRIPDDLEEDLVSIIINTYNEKPEILEQAVRSYENQIGIKTQIIISTVQNDPSIIYGNRHTLVCSSKPGIYEQLNNACDFIKGQWFCYASGNDVAEPTKCRDEVRNCYENNKLVCYSDFFVVDRNLKHPIAKTFKPYSYKDHLVGNFVTDCALINTQLLKKFLPFRHETYGNHAYWDLWLRIYEKYGDVFCYLPKKTWRYRQEETSAHIERKNNVERIKKNIDLRVKLQKDHQILSQNLSMKIRKNG